jgi:formylglycine-generating enzyme required for sulfatase activity
VSAAAVRNAQAAWARYLGRQVEEEDEIAPGVKMTLVLVPPGKFLMGSPEGESERPPDEVQHQVTITEPFYLGKHEVTQAQYEALLGQDKDPSHFRGADLPVESVTWKDAADYADQLTKQGGAGPVYRLPTEAEWEYACRGGRSASKPFGVGDGRELTSREANFDGNYAYPHDDKGPYLKSTCRVGSYPSNALGLADMHGNVWEWCADWYGPYPEGSVTNPSGPPEGSKRVSRGGSWAYSAWHCRSACRHEEDPGKPEDFRGFRLARSVPPGGK